MKILQINAVNAIFSTGRTCVEFSKYFTNKGDECITAFSRSKSIEPKNEYQISKSKIDVKIHAFFSRLSGKQGYFSKSATRKLLKFISSYSPDVIILRNLHGNYINLPMLLRYIAKENIPTVAVLHDCWFYTGKCCHYTKKQCYKWQNECGNCPSLKIYNTSWFFDRTAKMLADKKSLFGSVRNLAVVGVSDWITSEAEKAPVFAEAVKIKRIYNWIDLDKFSPKDTSEFRKELNLDGKKIILCAASGWNREKGLDTVLKVAERLSDDEIILMVGNVDDDIELNKNIIHFDTTNSIEELVRFYSLADVFLQPSVEETFGKVSAEALACGTPVVCFDSTANTEIVGDGCGSSVKLGDIDGAVAELRRVLAVGKEKFSAECRLYAEKNFSMNKNLDEYKTLLEWLIENKKC